MADIRIKDLANTATSVPADAYEVIDSASGGTEKISRDNKRLDMAAAFVAAPGTYNLAPLSGGAVEVAKGGTGAGTAAGARTNLSVNSIDEDAQANALKTTAPSMYFNGSSSVVTVAHDSRFNFTDGSDDLPFSISAWVKMEDVTDFPIVAKYQTPKEWLFDTGATGDLRLFLLTDSSNSARRASSTNLSAYVGQWVHLAATYAGTSGGVFSSAGDGITLFVNGVAVEMDAAIEAGTYAGMTNTSAAVTIGSRSGADANGSIRGVKIFNRELTSTEIAQLARGNDLGFADEWGGALGGVYTQDATPSGEWNANSGTDSDVAGPINGRSNVLGFTVNNTSSSDKYLRKLGVFEVGKRYRLTFDYNIDAANDVVDSIRLYCGGFLDDVYTPTAGTWNTASIEFVAANADLRIYAFDGTSQTVYDPAGDDIFYIDGLTLTEIGTLADFRAERYDTSTNKLYCLSDNAFVGTGTSVSLTGREVPVYETGTWTPVYTPSSGSFTALTMDVTDATYTRVGNLVTVSANIKTDNLDVTGASGNLQISGLPFTASGIAAGSTAFTSSWTTHPVACWVSDNSTLMFLGKQTSLGGSTTTVQVSDMQDGAVANANNVYITATYQIK